MKVKKLIQELKKFDPNHQVVITDGFDARVYHGKFEIKAFDGNDEIGPSVDIGIGGTRV